MATRTPSISLLFVLLASLVIGGCAGQQHRHRSSVVDYLYPNEKETAIKPAIPRLTLPLKVGIAFVPVQLSTSQGRNLWAGRVGVESLTETDKVQLLDEVAAHFKKYEFVKSIEVIPSAYLTPGGGFTNLKQIKTMYGVDVIALVSYDQVQFTDEGMLSLTYWTLVGAYIFQGEKNDTSTLMDTVVYDISSRKMLFRAPGTSQIKGSATPVNLSEELRADSLKGFKEATGKMIENLDLQLTRFKDKVKERPEEYQIVRSSGYSGGGGGMGWAFLAIVLLPLALWRRKSHHTPS